MNSNEIFDRTIFDGLPLPAFLVDADLRIVDLNSAAAQLCDQNLEAVRKSPAGEVLRCVHSDAPECGRSSFCPECIIRNSVTTCLQGQAIRRARMRMDRIPASGAKKMQLLVTTSPVPNSGGQLALLILEDISSREQLEQALRRSERLAHTGRLTATIAHEINNPLETLGNLLFLLQAESLQQSAKELVDAAIKEVERLASISRQTLALHRETRLPVTVSLSELLDEVIEIFRGRLKSSHIELRREYRANGRVSVFPGQLRQVFANLIANAIDAIGHDGEIRLVIEESPKAEVIVRISDTGCGIPPEYLSTIFEPFFTTKGEKGTGIGLWVVKGILAKAGGTIEVTSSTKGTTGTCFSLILPAHV